MGKDCWGGPAYSLEPISRASGLVAHPLELAAYPPDDIGIDPLQGRTQLRLIEVAVIGDPAADAWVVHPGQFGQGLVAAIASASMIFDVIHEDFPKTTLAFIEEKLSESDRQGARGCRLIGGEVEDEDEPAENEDAPDAGEPEASEEEVAEEPRPFLPDPAAHLAAVDERKAELKRILRDALLSETAVKLLINATMGLGKTYSSMEAIAATAGPPPPPAASVVNLEEEAPTDDDDPLKLDLSTVGEDLGHPRCVTRTNQVVFAAQRHDLLKEAAGFLRDALRERGWPDDVIDANIVIGQSRERGLCFRTDEELKMVTQAHGDIRPSLCVNRKGIRCPHFSECKVSGWLAMKDKMATSRFVFLTHAHLFSPWAAPGKPGERFHPAHESLGFCGTPDRSGAKAVRAGLEHRQGPCRGQ